MEKAFKNWRNGAVLLTFPNGNNISTTWASGSYSDNHDSDFNWTGKFVEMKSNTCEIMIECPDKLYKKIHRKYAGGSDNTVIGYLDIKEWAEIVALLAK